MNLGNFALLLAESGVDPAWPIATGATLLSLGLLIFGLQRFNARSARSR